MDNTGRKRSKSLLQQAREARGWTQNEVADRLQVSTDAVRSWENGRRLPQPAQRARLCHLFQLSPAQLGLAPTKENAPEERSTRHSFSEHVLLEQSEETEPPVPLKPTHRFQARPVFPHHERARNRQKMLSVVRSIWIEGVLQRSLSQAILIQPDLLTFPQALHNPWHLTVQETSEPAHLLPGDTSLLHVYDDAAGELLLLGEPGSGKTTLLLVLTSALLTRAEQDEHVSLPVIFHLASWSGRSSSLEGWLSEELQNKYRVPWQVSQRWVAEDHLIVLLDGLDEVAEESRPACIEAIRVYHHDHPLVSLVVCCRQEAYLAQPVRLALRAAIVVQPLTPEQVEEYLAGTDHQREIVHQLLRDDTQLRDMCTNPLMLRMVTLTYGSETIPPLVLTGSMDERRRHLFHAYVRRMLRRRGVDPRYHAEQTVAWLTWLARQMHRHHLTEFYLERIQPDWLTDLQVRARYRRWVMRSVYGLECLLLAGLFALLRGGESHGVVGVGIGLLGWLGSGPGNTVLGWMASGLGGGLEGGGSLGIIFSLVLFFILLLAGPRRPMLSWRAVYQGIRRGGQIGLLIGILVGIFSGLLFTFSGGIANGVLRGSGAGLFSGLVTGLESSLVTILRPVSSWQTRQNRPDSPVWRVFSSLWSSKAREKGGNFLFLSGCAGLSFGGGYILLIHRINLHVVWYTAIVALFAGLFFNLGDGMGLIEELGEHITLAETASWSWLTAWQAVRATVRKTLWLGLMVTLTVMLLLGCASSAFYGAAYGFHYALVYGPIVGLAGASAGCLTGILNQGWSSTMLPEHLLVRPNEGLRRTSRNALFAAGIFGPLGGLVSGLVGGLAFWWPGGLSTWPILAGGFAIVFGVIFSLQFFLLFGGIAWIEHLLLRWFLWRTGGLPVNSVPFLDYAVERILLRKIGGGYAFSHRLLQDYFATLDPAQVFSTDEKDLAETVLSPAPPVRRLKARKT